MSYACVRRGLVFTCSYILYAFDQMRPTLSMFVLRYKHPWLPFKLVEQGGGAMFNLLMPLQVLGLQNTLWDALISINIRISYPLNQAPLRHSSTFPRPLPSLH